MNFRDEVVAMVIPEGAKIERFYDGKTGTIKSVRGVWVNCNLREHAPHSVVCYTIDQFARSFKVIK